jgi:hypothetical protein
MNLIFEAIGTPADSPKPRGKSPGWKAGQPRQRRIRYPIVKKLRRNHVKSKKNRLSIREFCTSILFFVNSVLLGHFLLFSLNSSWSNFRY